VVGEGAKMKFEEFAKEVKKGRLSKCFYSFAGMVEGKEVRLKGYLTWLQIYDVDGVRYGGNSDISVKEFNDDLKRPFG
jgi:hypothetical protein